MQFISSRSILHTTFSTNITQTAIELQFTRDSAKVCSFSETSILAVVPIVELCPERFDGIAVSLRSGLCNEDHGPKTLETRHARRWMKIGVLENFQSRAAVRWTLVLRSRRGWGGGRAHGRAPPLPKGTYISWLAVGITRSYNTIASASSATKHASSREYSSLFLLHRSVSHFHGVSLFLGNDRVVLVAWQLDMRIDFIFGVVSFISVVINLSLGTVCRV